MVKKGLVSILIPCYNHEKFVQDCLQSILHQTYPMYEVLIVDDCSQDQSVSKIKEMLPLFEQKGINVVMMQNEINQGITKNLNRMLEKAEGEYIKAIASDDMLCPEYLSEMIRLFESDDEKVFLFSNMIKIGENVSYPVTEKEEGESVFQECPDCKNDIISRIFLDNFIPAPALIFRKSVFDKVGKYDESIGIEDLEMSLRVLRVFPEGLGCTDKTLAYYRINENSMTSLAKNKGAKRRLRYMHKNCIKIAKKHRKSVPYKIYLRRLAVLYYSYFVQMLSLTWKG